MSHVLKDGERFKIDPSGNVTVFNCDDKEIVKDGRVLTVPMFFADSARKAAPVFDAAMHRPGYVGARAAPVATADAAKAQSSHQRMKDRKANAWKYPEPITDAPYVAQPAHKPDAPMGDARPQDSAWEAMRARKANAWANNGGE